MTHFINSLVGIIKQTQAEEVSVQRVRAANEREGTVLLQCSRAGIMRHVSESETTYQVADVDSAMTP